jgi:hypothetical protein
MKTQIKIGALILGSKARVFALKLYSFAAMIRAKLGRHPGFAQMI